MFAPLADRAPTSRDVARLAGVSRTTVSFVLNERVDSRIPEETRRRVREAAERLGYTPNSRAQVLRGGSVEGLLIPAPVVGFGGAMNRAFQIVTQESPGSGFATLVHADHDLRGVAGARVWARYRPEAVLVEAARCDAEATEILRLAGVRALLVYGPAPVPHAPSLVIDQGRYGELAVAHLAERGRRRLVYLRPSFPEVAEFGELRLAGAVREAARRDVTLDTVVADVTAASLCDWARARRFGAPAFDGVVAYDDRFAFAALRALHDAGVRVPGEVAVVGADGYPAGDVFVPSLTTIAFDPQAMADVILRALNDLRAGVVAPWTKAPPLALITRESS